MLIDKTVISDKNYNLEAIVNNKEAPSMIKHVPVDDEYTSLIGKAVYVFAYYEWTIIWIIEYLAPGFVNRYSRGNPMTPTDVHRKLQEIIDGLPATFTNIFKQELQVCCNAFGSLTVRHNALIHAHPCFDAGGKQILTFQAETSQSLHDMEWTKEEVTEIISEFDAAAGDAHEISVKVSVMVC